jgi:hypothetical protein
MKQVKILLGLCGAALWLAGCAIPMGDNLLITRDGNTGITYIIDYNLQTYVPIPSAGQQAVTMVNNRGDLDLIVVWKDQSGNEIPGLTVFAGNTVYKAEIKLTPKTGYGFDPYASFGYHPGKVTAQSDNMGDPTRIVTVTYNNSDEADITYVTDYNLQSYIPIPLAGEKPVWNITNREDVRVEAGWKTEQTPGVFVSIPAGDSYTFTLGAVYRADIRLTANSGYRFSAAKNFEYPAGTVSTQPGSDSDPSNRALTTITYMATQAAAVISDLNLAPYIPKPVTGNWAVPSCAGGQYLGTVVWKNTGTQTVLVGPFQADTEYTAEASLVPRMGYTFTGVGQDTFVHAGAGSVRNAANSGTVRIDFLPTASAGGPTVVYDTNLTSRIAPPAYGVTPVKSFAGNQYTGSVVWTKTVTQAPLLGSFQSDTEYTAVVTLIALSGYTFAGIGENAFIHADAVGTTNAMSSGIVTINFPPEAFLNYTVNSFGPVSAADSALKVMTEKSDDDRAVFIELSPGTEEVVPSSVNLVGELNSPANVTIDGRHRVLKISSPGTLLTVGERVSLTLRNMTLIGDDANNAPLVKVLSGGRLILEGVTLQENQTTGNAGGAWVNGGALVMEQGSAIKRMTVTEISSSNPLYQAGGVFIDNNGRFTMNGGIIGGENSADGNTVSTNESGGGVNVYDGGFDMYGGTIRYNTCNKVGGGGVFVQEGFFNQYGGTIKENTASDGAGGVYISESAASPGGTFTMDGAEAFIEGNTASGGSNGRSGGGVYVSYYGTFTMRNGTIQGNTARDPGPFGDSFAGGVLGIGDLIMYGGTIKKNKVEGTNGSSYAGAVASKNLTMYGGTIGGGPGDANIATGSNSGARANGVLSSDHFIMSGGIITGNTDSLAANNYGVYVKKSLAGDSYDDERFTIQGSAQITEDNPVFLVSEVIYPSQNTNMSITIGGNLSASLVANIIMGSIDPVDGTRLLWADSEALIAGNYDKFKYNGSFGHIDSTPVSEGGKYYGVYKP